MAVHNFEDLRKHVGHKLACVVYEDPKAGIEDSAAIECVDCGAVMVNFDVEDDCVEWTAWQLSITSRFGTDNYLFQDETTARDQLYLHVFEKWPTEFPNEPCPEDHAQAIDDYFADNERESYILTEQPVLCEVET